MLQKGHQNPMPKQVKGGATSCPTTSRPPGSLANQSGNPIAFLNWQIN